jgi:hypothetical protein
MTTNFAHRQSGLASSPYVIAAVLFAAALLLRLFGIGDAPPRTDDLYNFIAARSWADNGTLAMADGFYTRTKYFSIVTGWFLDLFGPTLGVARAVAAIGGAALVGVLALWVRRIGGPLAGWSAGILLCFSYTCITWSQVARFYSWHAVAMLVLAIAVYAIVTGLGTMRLSRTLGWAVVALVALLCGLHLQAITTIMLIALAVWSGLYLLFGGRFNFIFRSPLLLTGSAIATAILIALILFPGRAILFEQWKNLRNASAWSAENQNNFAFYIDQLSHQLGWLFLLFPAAAIIVWRRHRTFLLFCVTIAAICLGLHTIAGMKALRYIMYVFPFFFAVWGLAVAVTASSCVGYLSRAMPTALGKWRSKAAGAALMAVAAVALLVVTDFRQTAAAATRAVKTGSPFQPFEYGFGRDQVDWAPYLPELRSLQKFGLFVVSDSNRAIYYLDDYDVLLSRTELSDVGKREFTLDKRTGKRDIGSGRSIEQIIRCYPKGSILTTEAQWRSAYITPDAADVIERKTKPVKLPTALNMRAYKWEHDIPAQSPACDRLYKMIGKDAKSVSS